MARIIAIDFGLKRTGLAVSDETETIAFPLITLPTHEIEKFLREYLSHENVNVFVIGKSYQANGKISDIEKHIVAFVNRLKKVFPNVMIERFDERFTSRIAQHSMHMAGYKRKDRQNKKNIDLMSATIILQDYLDAKKRL